MLSAPDSDLAQRDPIVPGLGVLLDPEAFVARLRRTEAALIERAKITYLRYKPGTNCLVAYRFELAGVEVEAFAVAYRLDLREKLDKARERSYVAGPLGARAIVVENHAIVVSAFPNDFRLGAPRRLVDPGARQELLRKWIPDYPELWEAGLEKLRYKPNRRFVARLSAAAGVQAALKVYTRQGYRAALAGARALESSSGVRTARLIGHSDRRHALAFEWLPGRGLGDILTDTDPEHVALVRTGAALAQLHAQGLPGLPHLTRRVEAQTLIAATAGIGELVPGLADRTDKLANELASRLLAAPAGDCSIHGDFYADQVLSCAENVGFLDFDRAARGDPAADLGNFIAHLERGALHGDLAASSVEFLKAALLEGYRCAARCPSSARIDLYTAAGLLRLAAEPFRHRDAADPDWPAQIDRIVSRAAAILRQSGARPPGHFAGIGRKDIAVSDPFDVSRDANMKFLKAALDTGKVQRALDALPAFTGHGGRAELRAIRVTRYKAGRRCLVEYEVELERPQLPAEPMILIGKARARGLDRAAFRLLVSLWNNGFGACSADGISVPEPVGVIADFQMWLQRKVPGTVATRLLPGPDGCELAKRVAGAIHKLHRSGIRPHRRHTMADELSILRERLSATALTERPQWRPRLDRLLNACERLGAAVPPHAPCGIHRDFYPDQLLIDGARLYLLDLDLYCEGDPALDIGNFLGHLTEQGLRTLGDPDALAEQENSLEERFIALSGAAMSQSIQAYKTLTLVRHIYISTLFPDRRAFTEQLLELCERRTFTASRHRASFKQSVDFRHVS